MRLPSFHEWLFKFEWESVVSEENRGAQPILGEAAVSDGRASHTPGPWRFDGDQHQGGWLIEGPGREVICSRNSWPHRAHESLANGRLIKAAPELLAALKWAAERIKPGTDLRDAMDAAIAKAEGNLSAANLSLPREKVDTAIPPGTVVVVPSRREHESDEELAKRSAMITNIKPLE